MFLNSKEAIIANLHSLSTTGSSSGMMGGNGMMPLAKRNTDDNIAINMDQAKTVAQQYLDANYTGTAMDQVTTYYTYLRMQLIRVGNMVGLESVLVIRWTVYQLANWNIHATENHG